MTPRQEAMVATCVCGWQTVCLPGDEHGPVVRLLEHRKAHPAVARLLCGGCGRQCGNEGALVSHQRACLRLAA